MGKKSLQVLCVQETKWKGSKAREIGAGYKLYYHGEDSKRNGIGIVLCEELKEGAGETGVGWDKFWLGQCPSVPNEWT